MKTKPKSASKGSALDKSKRDTFDILDGQVKIFRTASQVWQMQMWVRDEHCYPRSKSA